MPEIILVRPKIITQYVYASFHPPKVRVDPSERKTRKTHGNSIEQAVKTKTAHCYFSEGSIGNRIYYYTCSTFNIVSGTASLHRLKTRFPAWTSQVRLSGPVFHSLEGNVDRCLVSKLQDRRISEAVVNGFWPEHRPTIWLPVDWPSPTKQPSQ